MASMVMKYIWTFIFMALLSTNFIFANKDDSVVINSAEIQRLLNDKEVIEKDIINNNIWSKIYSNYHTFQLLEKQREVLALKISTIKRKIQRKIASPESIRNLSTYTEEYNIINGKLELLEEYEDDPFKKLLTPPYIEAIPEVTNPFEIIEAMSYMEKLDSDYEVYDSYYVSLKDIVLRLEDRQSILEALLNLDGKNELYTTELHDINEEIKAFNSVADIFDTSKNVHLKKIDEIKINLDSEISREVGKIFYTLALIGFFFMLLSIFKYFVRKYMSDNDRYYIINKALNIIFVVILIFILLLTYISNVSYLVTILGFASAGIAIAMKDWFMSLMGWLTIVLGGAIHVGDRVKFVRDGVEYVGDIVDISLLRMTMHEDVTLTTSMINRRAGRIVFIPNNFIFTDMIANYSHAGLKTVWDGIDFVITFDSDTHKAAQIAKEVSKKFSKGYTEMTRKQLNRLRSQYSMKNTNVEPRVFTLIEPYGMKISVWYLTNSYATLTLRSTISTEIINRIQSEENIRLAFPTQSIYVDKDVRKPNLEEMENSAESIL